MKSFQFVEEISENGIDESLPEEGEHYGHFVNQLLFGSDWMASASVLWQGYITQEFVKALRLVCDCSDPLTSILPILQTAFLNQMTTKELMDSFESSSDQIEGKKESEAALKNELEEVALLIHWFIEQKTPSQMRRFLPSTSTIHSLIADRMIALTSRKWANLNLFLRLLDGVRESIKPST